MVITASSQFIPPPSHAASAQSYPLERCIGPQDNDADAAVYNAQSPQSVYIASCGRICRGLCDWLSQRPAPFGEVLKWLGDKRREIAQGSMNEEAFGVLRSYKIYGKVSTPLVEQYASLLDAMCAIDEQDPTMDWECFDSNPSGYNIGVRLANDFKGQVIQLSKYLFFRMPGDLKSVIAHTNQEDLRKALDQCAYLYDEILRLEDEGDIRLKLAELHWWMAQACPYKRGSASCTEILIAALSEHKQIPLTPYKKGIYPDRIALVEPLENFVQIYSSLRDERTFI